MKKIILLSLFVVTFCFVNAQIDLDLNNLTLNKLSLNELTLDKITDMIGRPTATNSNPLLQDVIKDIGVQIYYHDKGLMFWFNPKKSDPKQKIKFMEVYFVKKWDQDYNEFFLPFSGKITPYINPNMKVNQILSIFNIYKPELVPAPEARKNHEDRMKIMGLPAKKSDIAHDRILIQREKGSVQLECEELTKFFENLTFFPTH